MRRWIDQATFDELLLANAEDNVERAIQSASAVLEAVQEFVPEATLFYHVTHAADSLKNYFEEVCTGFRRNGILFLVRQYFYPKPYYDLRFDWSFFRYADNYSYGKAFDKQTAPNRIGVFTKKKIDDWVEYLTQGFRNLERIDDVRSLTRLVAIRVVDEILKELPLVDVPSPVEPRCPQLRRQILQAPDVVRLLPQ